MPKRPPVGPPQRPAQRPAQFPSQFPSQRPPRSFSRAWSMVCLVLVIALTPAGGHAQASGTLVGHVRSEGNGDALPGAELEVRSGVVVRRALTVADGSYVVSEVPAGRSRMRVRYLGHMPLEMEVVIPGGGEVRLDVMLPLQPVVLAPVNVEANGPGTARDSMAAEAPALGMVSARALDAGPGLAELGIADAVRGIPGNEPTDPGSVLYVRGGAADLKLVYLDGAPVYAPFPLGGLLEPFATRLLQRAYVYLGGAPARFDGGLSYVMDLRTRTGRGDGFRTSGALDLLSAQALAEGGIGDRVTLIASGRAIHPLAGAGMFADGLPYEYAEGLLRMDARLGATGLLSVTGFANDEAVTMGDSFPGDGTITWGNRSGSVRYQGTIGRTLLELTGALGDYSARLPVTGSRPITAGGEVRRSRLSADLARRIDGVQLRYGSSIERQEHHASAVVTNSSGRSGVLEGAGTVAGVYAEAAGQIGQRVRVRAGGRMDHFSTRAGLTLAPRIAATWLVSERAALTLAAGRYHQFLRPPDEVLLRSEAPETLTAGPLVSAPLAVGSASHFTVALDQELGDGMRLGLEGFFKEFSGIPGGFSVDANASGADLWVRRETGLWTGWLGYSLAWVWSSQPTPGSADFAGRHLLNTGLGGPVLENARLDLRFTYGAGLPYAGIPLRSTAVPSSGPPSYESASPALTFAQRGGTETAPLLHAPQEPFLRLDASISQSWEPIFRERRYEITPYLRLLNTLGRRDALFYYFDHDADGTARPIGSLPIVPVVGMEWRF